MKDWIRDLWSRLSMTVTVERGRVLISLPPPRPRRKPPARRALKARARREP
jgi:hypothetical protein